MSYAMITTIPVEIINLDESSHDRLNRILARDTRVIERYLGLLQYLDQSDSIFVKHRKWSINKSALDKFTLTTRDRAKVKFDLKDEFKRISNNELQECRDTAIAIYLSFLEMRDELKHISYPTKKGHFIPRIINRRRASFNPQESSLVLWDTLDSNLKMILDNKVRTVHDKLTLQLNLYNYAMEILQQSVYKGCKIIKENNRYFAHLHLNMKTPIHVVDISKPIAVLGIDLGIAKTVATSLLTSNAKGIVEKRNFDLLHLKKKYYDYQDKFAHLQQQAAIRDDRRLRRVLHERGMRCGAEMSRIYQLNSYIKQYMITRHPTTEQVIYSLIHKIETDLTSIPIQDDKHGNQVQSFQMTLAELTYELQSGKLGKYNAVYRQINNIRKRRYHLKRDIIRNTCSQLTEYISSIAKKYDAYIILGDLKGIRDKQVRGSGNKSFRKLIHQWSFFAFKEALFHDLNKVGLHDRLFLVKEYGTSAFCHRCHHKGTRPEQSLFVCSNIKCGWRGNADINGATNIALRGIRYLGKQPHFPKIASWVRKSDKSSSTLKKPSSTSYPKTEVTIISNSNSH